MRRLLKTMVLLVAVLFTLVCSASAAKKPDHSAELEEIKTALQTNPATLDINTYGLTCEEIAQLIADYPETEFLYDITIYGLTFAKDTAVVDLDSLKLRKKGELKELKAALPLFTNLEEVDMYNCNLPRDQMEELWSAYPNVHWGWSIKFGSHLIRTDIQAFSSLHSPTNTHYSSNYYSALKYCWRIKALDLGHNKLTDISFIGYMTDLRVLILADNQIKDISPLANCTKLQYVELFMNRITDLTPLLASKDTLLDLNICHGSFGEIEEVYQMPHLERLWITSSKHMTKEYVQSLVDGLPNVEICNDCQGSTGGGWREHDRYFIIYEMFNTYTYIPFQED